MLIIILNITIDNANKHWILQYLLCYISIKLHVIFDTVKRKLVNLKKKTVGLDIFSVVKQLRIFFRKHLTVCVSGPRESSLLPPHEFCQVLLQRLLCCSPAMPDGLLLCMRPFGCMTACSITAVAIVLTFWLLVTKSLIIISNLI